MSHSTFSGPACAGPAPLYDFAALGRLAEDQAFVLEIKQLFVHDTPARLTGLQVAVAAANWHSAGREAHSLKSMMGTLGLRLPMHLLQQVEQAAGSGQGLQYVPTLLRALQAAVAPVLQALQLELGVATAVPKMEPLR